MKLYLEKYPSGKYGFVGGVPEILCNLAKNSIGQEFLKSKVYETKRKALRDLYDNGICPHCKEEIAIRNPSGNCDHLFYPDSCKECQEIIGKYNL